MELALEQARLAANLNETPIGAVLVWEGEVVASAFNRRELDRIATAHAEILAINEACRKLGGWRLHKATLYVTLEPCPMCAGAMVMAQLDGCVFGAYDARQGCCGSVYDLPHDPAFFHRVPCAGGVLENECARLLRAFFERRRGDNAPSL